MNRRTALIRLGALTALGTLDLLSLLLEARADPVTATVRLRLPSGFDSTVTVLTDTVTVFERSAATCDSPGQPTVAHQLGATALTAFHRAMEQFQLPQNPCGVPYELKYFPSYGALYLRAVTCSREHCQVLGWVYLVNGEQPGIGMDQQPIVDGDEIVVDFLPVAADAPEEIDAIPPFTVTVGPNPVDESTEIHVVLREDADVSVGVYNPAGRCVHLLLDRRELRCGTSTVRWSGTDARRMPVPTGIYVVRVTHHPTGDVRRVKVYAR